MNSWESLRTFKRGRLEKEQLAIQGEKKKALQEKHVPRRKKTEIYIMILSSS